MKLRFLLAGAGVCVVLGGAMPAGAQITYYVNDLLTVGDVYTTAIGNDLNPGTSPGAPKLTLNGLISSATLNPGDVVLIDTGTYPPANIPATVNGAPGNRIVFQGSTNSAAGGTVFTGSGTQLDVRANRIEMRDIRVTGGNYGISLNNASHNEFVNIISTSSLINGVVSSGLDNSNVFRRCVIYGVNFAGLAFQTASVGNYVEHSILGSVNNIPIFPKEHSFSNIIHCILVAPRILSTAGNYPATMNRNVISYTTAFGSSEETLADLQRLYTNWVGNTVADPRFVNAAALDFHLLSTAGYATNNNPAVTNIAAVHSPAIDFGRLGADVGDEPAPNGGRVNVGLYGGTAEASKSRTDPWLFAMTFNDGGTLIQTGRMEWVGGNLGGATVDLEYSTNNAASWQTIAAGVTNETYTWVPAAAHPAVLWRVRDPVSGVASTNAKVFSIRPQVTNAFVFYVNDNSLANDVYTTAVGNNANLGVSSNAPKATLQAIVDTYSLRGGDVIYVDTGTYAGQTTTIGGFDSGTSGNPIRIIGSPNGTTFNRGNTSADVLDLTGASHLEIEYLRLEGGRYGLNGGTTGITLRNMQFNNNVNGVFLTGSGHIFENCLAAGNTTRAFWGSGNGQNQWRNGVMWNSPTLIHAQTNTLSVSNSILVGNGPAAALIGNQIVYGNHNVVWNTGTGIGAYPTFTVFQDAAAGLGLGWDRSGYADPLFANAAGGDFHLKSVEGRYNPGTGLFETNDVVHSPAIDFGNPAAAVGAEPAPNGGRRNAGLYGGTAQASKSRTNAWVQLLNYMDGGTLNAQAGTTVRWEAGQYDPGATVALWLSRDGGLSWELLESGLDAATGSFFYQDPVPDDSSSRQGRLRVELEGADPEAISESPTNFTYVNGTFSFYINDDSTVGDMYCTAPGKDANAGTSPGTPKATFQGLFAEYGNLTPGDRIYVDTGSYSANNPVVLGALQSGTTNQPIQIIGSTNRLAGGSVFGQRTGAASTLGFYFQPGASNIVMTDIVLTNVVRGVAMTNALNIRLEGVEVRGATSRAFDLQGNTRQVELLRPVAHRGNTGVYLQNATNITIRHGVFWENTGSGIQAAAGTGVLVENSVLASTRLNASLFTVSSLAGFFSDYNGLHVGPTTRVGSLGGSTADNLSAWQRMTAGRDEHSIPGDPQLADPEQWDYHLKTEQTLGRLRPNGTRTSDPVSSPLLNAGNPETDPSEEPEPNGGRVNIGRWGGTEQASIAPMVPWIRVVTLADAGGVTNGAVALRWTEGGFTNETARVEVSVNGGRTWQEPPVAEGIPVTNRFATWTVDGLPATPAGVWRVVLESNTNLWARNTNFFWIRGTNQALDIYVAKADTNDNVYATGAGAPDNWMASVEEPMDSLRTVFERFDLEPGDRIWVDTGSYAENDSIELGMKNSGSAANPVRITGNTNRPYHATVLARVSRTLGSSVFQLSRAGGVRIEGVMISNAWTGIQVDNTSVTLEQVRVGYCGTNGVLAGAATPMTLNRVILEQNLGSGLQTAAGANVNVRHSLIRGNGLANFYLAGGTVHAANNVMEAIGASRFVYFYGQATTLIADYNNIRALEGAHVAGGINRASDRFLIDWQISSAFARDKNSFGYDPLFADAEAYDFHPMSEYGRYDPGAGVFVTNDAATSRLIDLGDPVSTSWTNEPAPNGGRVNVGLHGGTAEASKSPEEGTLVPLTMSDGGTVRGTVNLFWAWNGIDGNEQVIVEFSADGGTTWTNLSTGVVYADQGTTGFEWDTTAFPSTAQGIWRVSTTNDPPVVGQTETLFAVKNDPLAYYVNDSSTAGDVFCTAPGSAANDGASPETPVNSIATLFTRYKIEHGDTIYIDTGVYPRSSPLTIAIPSAGVTNRLVIQGSTNPAAGGTILTNSSLTAVLELQGMRNVDLRDLHLKGGRTGLTLQQSSSNRLERVRSTGARIGFDLSSQSDQNEFVRCAALHFMGTGIYVAAVSGQVAPATNHWRQGVIASVPADGSGAAMATGTLASATTGRLNIHNSVMMANGPLDLIYQTALNVIQGDYNAYHRAETGARFARVARSVPFGVRTIELDHLNTWVEWNGTDANSFAADPQFADLSAGNLYPKSRAGRYAPELDDWVQDDVDSPLIDTADPLVDWSLEPVPHGGRANIGLYGGTEVASLSGTTDGSIVLLTLNEGGVVRGDYTLRWLARGGVTNGNVNIRLSTDSGGSWTIIATVPATNGQLVWSSTNHPSLPTARWRVDSLLNPAWMATSTRDFLIHNEPLTYYVNDGSISNAVYCTAIGSVENTGRSPSSPLPSLADVLARYDIEPGDRILIDTGVYTANVNTAIGYLDSGTAEVPVRIEGSTTHPGTLFQGHGWVLSNARGLELTDLKFQSATNRMAAPMIENSEEIRMERLDALGGSEGFIVSGSSNILLRNFLVAFSRTNGLSNLGSFNTRVEFGTIWSNRLTQVAVSSQSRLGVSQSASYLTVSNTIMGAFGLRRPVYDIRGTLYADHNNYHLVGGALAALTYEAGFPREFNSVGRWAAETGLDRYSLSHDPLFANATAGDFHLQSQAGRWVPANGDWVIDGQTSPMIDAGHPDLVCIESEPNGGRVNIGRYGNTPEASKTPTNGALTLVSFHDGGRAVGTEVEVVWLARGATTSATVRILYSADGGGTWLELASGIPAAAGVWIWDSTLVEQSVQAMLRIESEGPDGATAQNTRFFAARNDSFNFYINDNSLVGDVYCTAIGNNLNSGLTNSAPMADLNSLLARYEVEGGDTIYIDTGWYRPFDPWRISQSDSAGSLDVPPVVIQGSTNRFPSGTVLDRQGAGVGLQMDYAVGVHLRNITVSNTSSIAVSVNNSYGIEAEWMAVGVANVAFQQSGGNQFRLARSAVYNANLGVSVGSLDSGVTNPVQPLIEHNVIWNSDGPCIQVGGSRPVILHNILTVQTNRYVYQLSQTAQIDSDYNAIWLGNGGRMFRQTLPGAVVPLIYDTVAGWATASGNDLHSYDGDPLLADPANRVFHLLSQAGRWAPGSGTWVNDLATSPLIDGGSLESPVGDEPEPNGGRVNIGPFGGTPYASKTPTNSALHILSLNHGGVASGQVALNWRASGLATGQTVRLSVTVDDGATWTVVAEGLAASLGGIIWNSQVLPSSPLARWRVESEDEDGVAVTSARPFVLHNSPILYYVNDALTDGDVYCTAPGSSANTGLSPDSPKLQVSEIIETYDLEPGDIIYVDTGNYLIETPIVFGDLDAGGLSQQPADQITVQGSTNWLYGGTRFLAIEPGINIFRFNNTYGIRLRDLQIRGGQNGIDLQGSYFIAGDWLDIRSCVNGVSANASSNIVMSRSVLMGNTAAGIRFDNGSQGSLRLGSSVMWSNQVGIHLQRGYVFASNTVFGMLSPESVAYHVQIDQAQTAIQGDYNSLYAAHPDSAIGAYAAGPRTTRYYSVAAWSAGTGRDRNSLADDPRLADPDSGDFHLKSVAGRYQPGTGWVVDTVSSPLIDAGHPGSPWTVEPDPNGRRLNIGLHGGTAEASKSPPEGWLTMLSLNDGGFASGDVDLRWTAGGAATNYTVCIEYSPDNGLTWTNIVCGWPASLGSYLWDSVPYGRSALSRWRIRALEDWDIDVVNLAPFLLRNGGAILYYVNDANTEGDVYCTAPGDDANDGLSPATPKATLQAILNAYQLIPEDVVYVDAGSYSAGGPPIRIDQRDTGYSNLFVTIQGSTNPVAPTEFANVSLLSASVFHLEYADYIRFRDLTIRNADVGVVLTDSMGCEFDQVRFQYNRSAGAALTRAGNTRFVRSVFWNNSLPSGGTSLRLNAGASAIIENSVLWGHTYALDIPVGSVTVTNSVLDASGTAGRILKFATASSPEGNYRGDYNALVRRNGALIAEKPLIIGGNDFYNDLPTWSAVSGSDQRSMVLNDPLFADAVNGDFHPLSTRGRYRNGIWTNDAVLSPLIDAGDPAFDSSQEPEPNGGIINIGAYGNTPRASMTQTNPPWLRVVSYNTSGDIMSGNVLLYWLHGGMSNDAPVRLDYSVDYQGSWINIASNIPAGSRQFEWDVSGMPLTLALFWRVVLQENPVIQSVSSNAVSVKTETYDYFINDNSTEGNVFTTAAGVPYNAFNPPGTNSSRPLNSLKTLLDNYPVSAGDRIFIDTGTYTLSSTNRIVFDDSNMGTAAFPLRIYGSTNKAAGGTRFVVDGTVNGFQIQNTRHIELHDIRISGGHNGVLVQNVDTIRLHGMELFNNLTNGLSISGSSGLSIRHSLFHGNRHYGVNSAGQLGSQAIEFCTLWGNQVGAVFNSAGALSISNSILVVTNNAPLFVESGVGFIGGNHNLLWKPGSGPIGSNLNNRIAYSTLRQWQAGGRDSSSVLTDPLFVNAPARNFHLQSRAGSWSNGSWPVSADTSWAIDAGNPNTTSWTNEPAPNGGRVNLGAYGGTRFASKTDASLPELFVASLIDGGVAQQQQPLYWLYRGLAPTNTLRIDYSPDNGVTWVTIAVGVRVDSAPYDWISSADPSPEALWRIVLESNTNLLSATTVPFVHRTRDLTYYVNDGSLIGDMYSTAVGSPDNLGYRSNSPLHSIQAVLDRYPISGGDRILVDTGVYTLEEPVFLTTLSRGTAAKPVGIIGSTNRAAGGTRLVPGPWMSEPAFIFYSTADIDLSWFHVHGFVNAVSFQGQGNLRFGIRDFDIQESTGPGLQLMQANDVRMERVLIRQGQTNAISAVVSRFAMDGCVLWSNRSSTISFGSGVQLEMTNSVIQVTGLGNYALHSSTTATIRANYNNYVLHDGARVASIAGLEYPRLPQWVRGSGQQDRFSLSTDPWFHDPANGDFHLRSVEGRYRVGAGWTQDTPVPGIPDFSPMIDMGSPQTAWTNEPSPNGGRRNIGLHGNTAEASLSDTNAWVRAITAMGGGLAFDTFFLTWGFGNLDPTAMVRLQYSPNDGLTWTQIADVNIGNRQYSWWSTELLGGSEKFLTSPAARWRLILVSDTNVWSMTENYFGLRNSPFTYYLNDDSMAGDVFTLAVGNDSNLGFFPEAPKRTLPSLLENIDLEASDRIYVDTGTYYMSDTNRPIQWDLLNSGAPGEPVFFRGSPNGSRFIATNRFVAGGFLFMNANHVTMRDLHFVGESMDFIGQGLVVSNVTLSNGNWSIRSDGSTFIDVGVDRGGVTMSGANNRLERMHQRWGQLSVVGTNALVRNSVVYTTNNIQVALVVNAVGGVVSNSTIVSSRGTALAKRGTGTLRLGHNILVAGGSDANSVIAWEDGALISDWNNLLARDSAWVGSRNGQWERLAYWQTASGQDVNSVSFDPKFQNELQGDFHLNSLAGRWSPSLQMWDTDGEHSPLIDMGDPWIGTGAEPMPNGYRRNLGAYGGTAQASKSIDTLWLRALTLNDGGVVKGTNVVLRWAYGNAGTTTVTLQYFDGSDWVDIATGLSATAGSYVWDTTGFPDSFDARWRIVAEDASGVSDETDSPFALRNFAHEFYVNDADTTDDVYCSAPGNDANDGLTPATPKRTLQALLNTYDLEPGDVVYVDTGNYPSAADVRIIWSRSGAPGDPIVIQGNTNGAHTILTRTGDTNFPAVGVDVKASDIELRHLAIRGINRGILLQTNRNVTMEGLMLMEVGTGISVEAAQGTWIRNSGFWRPSTGIRLSNTRTSVLENLTFALPSVAGIQMNNTVVDTLQNNIFIPAEGAYAYSVGAQTSLLMSAEMDYNLYDFEYVAEEQSGFYEGATTNNLRRWQLAMDGDYRSSITNAELASFEFEPIDLHPLSEYGRWTPGGWTLDGTTSWAVDHGNPFSDFSDEPEPHGERINIGMHGNTPQASKGRIDPEVLIRTLNGEVTSLLLSDPTWPLVWSSILMEDFDVHVQFGTYNPETAQWAWVTLGTVPISQEYFIWNIDISHMTLEGRWRIVRVDDPDVAFESSEPFGIPPVDLAFRGRPYPVSGLVRFDWEGGVAGMRYIILYSDDFGQTWQEWDEKYNGPAPLNRSNFAILPGETKEYYTFEDRTSYLIRQRWYRLMGFRD